MSTPVPASGRVGALPHQAEPLEGQVLVHFLDRARHVDDQRGVAAGGHDPWRAVHLGLHALQMLPLAAFLFVRRGWQEMRRVRMVWAIAVSYVSFFSLLLWQALRGQSVMAPDGTTIALLTFWAALTVLAMWAAASRAVPARVHALV